MKKKTILPTNQTDQRPPPEEEPIPRCTTRRQSLSTEEAFLAGAATAVLATLAVRAVRKIANRVDSAKLARIAEIARVGVTEIVSTLAPNGEA